MKFLDVVKPISIVWFVQVGSVHMGLVSETDGFSGRIAKYYFGETYLMSR